MEQVSVVEAVPSRLVSPWASVWVSRPVVGEKTCTVLVVRQVLLSDIRARAMVVCGWTKYACSGGTPVGRPVAVSAWVAVTADQGSDMASRSTVPPAWL